MIKYTVYKNGNTLIDNVTYNQAFGLLDSAQRYLESQGMKTLWDGDRKTTTLKVSNGNIYKAEAQNE